ncbi:DNA-directed RNA polymerase subunit alpha C-terminal domain-containing protein [Nocardia neocaledoniensis]|uniref:DNA-directed RNA polymerase subunit alpha C-terminal domain-containing protein n=1 Tax=Nocardia neocaledoniensis TaxID=236511 RepID=UPI0033F28CF2
MEDLTGTRLHTMLSGRVANMLGREGIHTLADLLDYTRSDLQRIRSFGLLTLAEIDDALSARGLRLPGKDPDLGPTLVEEFHMVLDQRDQLLALINRISTEISAPDARHDIVTTLKAMNLTPTVRQTARTHSKT